MNRTPALDAASVLSRPRGTPGAGASDAWRREMERAQMRSWFTATVTPSHSPPGSASAQDSGDRLASVDGSRSVRVLSMPATWAVVSPPEVCATPLPRAFAMPSDGPFPQVFAHAPRDVDEGASTAILRAVSDCVSQAVCCAGQPLLAPAPPVGDKAAAADKGSALSPMPIAPGSAASPEPGAWNVHVESDGACARVWLAGAQVACLAEGPWRSLLSQLRADLQRQGRDLVTLTLNGQRVWERCTDTRSNDHLTEA